MAPFAFAVGSDRTFWVLDEVNRRVAHYSSGGEFLGELRGLRFDRFHAHPRDLVMAGGRPVVLEQRNWSLAGIVDVPDRGRFTRTPVTVAGRPVWVSYLVPTAGPVVGWVNGAATAPPAPPASGPHGAARFDVPGSGRGRFLPGFPLGDGGYVRLEYRRPERLDVTFTRPEGASVLPIRLVLIAAGRRTRAASAVISQTTLRHGLAAVVQIAPTGPENARRYGDGRWLLQLSDDGSRLGWQRIPQPAFDDETVVRHITTGPGDSLYLMQVRRAGISLYRR